MNMNDFMSSDSQELSAKGMPSLYIFDRQTWSRAKLSISRSVMEEVGDRGSLNRILITQIRDLPGSFVVPDILEVM